MNTNPKTKKQTKELKLKKSVIRELEQAERDFKEGKNISPVFTNMDDAIAWLRSSD